MKREHLLVYDPISGGFTAANIVSRIMVTEFVTCKESYYQCLVMLIVIESVMLFVDLYICQTLKFDSLIFLSLKDSGG